jgi:hypothetical protein
VRDEIAPALAAATPATRPASTAPLIDLDGTPEQGRSAATR